MLASNPLLISYAERAAAVLRLEYYRDLRPVTDAVMDGLVDLDARSFRAGLSFDILVDPDNLVLVSVDYDREEESRSLRRQQQVTYTALKTAAIGLGTYQPGWRWSLHAGPQTGKESENHIGYIISGRMMVSDTSGNQVEIEAGFVPGLGMSIHVRDNGIGISVDDIEKVLEALDAAKNFKGQPTAIIAHTIKGKGVSFMENNVDFHGKAPNAEQLEKALKELA